MKAYVTSVGETTTELCVWALERNGFDVVLLENPKTTLAQKLKDVYFDAVDDFVRVDADIIVNRHFTPSMLSWLPFKNSDCWWWQFMTFDLLKLDLTHSMAYIKHNAIPALQANIDRVQHSNRPETEMSRIKELHEPRRFDTYKDEVMGLHGLKADLERAKKLKHIRNQQDLYDFEMAGRINAL